MCRNQEIRVKYKKDEIEKIKDKAQELGVTMAAYIRMVSLKADIQFNE